ncbi:hypothetical protein F4810DRAFT_440630 [Camillea tinctor]|nr:hypothetical protein F4810DRAFT_440630 [Camillea tinctor]
MDVLHHTDGQDLLEDACRQAAEYPTGDTYIAVDVPPSLRKNYHRRLIDDGDLLFIEDHDDSPLLVFLARNQRSRAFTTENIHNFEELREHLSTRSDPQCRHVFIEANHSRAPLNCTLPMMQLLLAFLQVNPIFLDSIHAFGRRLDPVDASLSQFQFDGEISGGIRIDGLGRSGRQLRHTYLLRSPEKNGEGIRPWSIRQTAVYHAFDLETGRALWITVKGNNVLQDAVRKDTSGYQENIESINKSFLFTLKTHLVYLRWCQEGWRWFVRDLDQEVREALLRGRTAPIGREPYSDDADDPDSQYTERPVGIQEKLSQPSTRMRSKFAGFHSRLKKTHGRSPYGQTPNQHISSQPRRRDISKAWPGPKQILDSFEFIDLQELNSIGDRIQEAVLVIKLDIKTLRELRMYYQELNERGELPKDDSKVLPKDDSQPLPPQHLSFLEKIQAIVNTMETRQIQLESLAQRLGEGKRLYESILEYKNLEMSRVYAEEAKQAAMHMEKIAFRTANETAPMHIITAVTLIFLPGTFLATFFQSGVLQWQEVADIQSTWLFRPRAFTLFIAICLPMMALIFLGWYLSTVDIF